MVEKIRHGSEITSAKLNEIISAVNKMDADNKEIVKLREDLDSRLDAIYNQLEGYSEQVAEHLDTLPEVKNLYADLLRARDSADWINLTEDCTDVDAFITNALAQQTEDITAQRLKIIRGTTTQITLNTPAVRDKQILLAFDPERNAGIMYMDIGSRRYPISSSEDTTITAVAPTFEFSESEGGVYLNTLVGGDVAASSPNLKGPAGEKGESGPQGPRGIDGKSLTFADLTDAQKQELKGAKGDQGLRGESTYIEIAYSNYSNGTSASSNYAGHDYIGIKTYTSNQSKESVPFKWIRFKADALYPHLEGDTLRFTKTLPASGETVSFNIRDWLNENGGKGDTGPQGPAPIIKFKDGEGNIVEAEKVELTEDPEVGNTVTYTYNVTGIHGPKGDKGDKGDKGEQGERGATPNIGFQTPNGSRTTLKEISSDNSVYDKLYLLDYPVPEDGLFPIEANLITNSSGQQMYQFKLGRQVGGVAIHTIECPAPVGPKGDPGSAYSIKGYKESDKLLPSTGNANDAYVIPVTDEETGITRNHVYVWLENDLQWFDIGDTIGTKGDPGEQGRRGSSIRANKITPKSTDYPGVYTLTVSNTLDYLVGDIYLDTNTNNLYQVTSVSRVDEDIQLNVKQLMDANNEHVNIKGDQGIQGIQGVQGKYISEISRSSVNEETRMATYTTTLYDPKEETTESGPSFQVQDGQDGADGEDGTKVFTGSDTPDAAIGVTNDIYIDWQNGFVYKKSANGWGEALNSGHAFHGRDGSKIFTCEYDPTVELDPTTTEGSSEINSIGLMPGDYMLRTTDYALYRLSGTFTDLAWESLGSLQGPKGEQGEQGKYVHSNLVTIDQASVSTQLQQCTYYQFTNTNITSITLTLATPQDGTVGEYIFEFTRQATGTNINISLPSTVKYANGWTQTSFVAGYKYIVYIVNNIAYVSYTEV